MVKINGQEIDMQKIVKMYEEQYNIRYDGKKKCHNIEWWNSTQGMAQRDKMREILSARSDTCHRQKIKYILTDVNTKEEVEVEGQQEMAEFLGYKKFNSDLRLRMSYTKQLSNKSRTKTYNINIKETL